MITRFLTLIFTLSLATPVAHAKGVCESFADKSPLADSIARFRELGFTNLLAEFDRGKIEITHRTRLFPWQPAVAAHLSFTGKKSLVVRRTELKKEGEIQKFVWQLALALFKLKVGGKFSAEMRETEDMSLAEFAVGFRFPKAWRDDKFEKAEETLKELYHLFMLLDKLDAETLLPKQDIRTSVRALLLRDGSRALVPNQEDFARLIHEGEEEFGQGLTERHKRSFLFSYYINHFRRLLAYGTTFTTVAALAPIVQEMPGILESSDSLADFLINLQINLIYYLVP